MKHCARVVVLCFFGMITMAVVQANEQLAIGSKMPMPGRQMKNVDGKDVAVHDAKGEKGTIVAFWCNHCPFVVKYRSRFTELVAEYKGKGFGFIAVNPNDPNEYSEDSFEKMQEHAKKFSYTFPYVVDVGSELAKAYGATRTPHIFLFDAEDKLVYVGAVDDSVDPGKVKDTFLKNAMDALLEAKAVKTTTSRALGCTIKWYKK